MDTCNYSKHILHYRKGMELFSLHNNRYEIFVIMCAYVCVCMCTCLCMHVCVHWYVYYMFVSEGYMTYLHIQIWTESSYWSEKVKFLSFSIFINTVYIFIAHFAVCRLYREFSKDQTNYNCLAFGPPCISNVC